MQTLFNPCLEQAALWPLPPAFDRTPQHCHGPLDKNPDATTRGFRGRFTCRPALVVRVRRDPQLLGRERAAAGVLVAGVRVHRRRRGRDELPRHWHACAPARRSPSRGTPSTAQGAVYMPWLSKTPQTRRAHAERVFLCRDILATVPMARMDASRCQAAERASHT